MDRHIKLQGIDNLRDFGGYATACGRGLARGRLYRSGHHHHATDEDLRALADLNIAVVVDLRRADEREDQPSKRWPGFSARVIDNDLGAPGEGWHHLLKDADPTAEFFHRTSLEWYRTVAFEPRLLDLYARYFKALAEADGAVLIHCAAGKDRTGLLAALTHHIAGVHREDIVEDYLLTNRAVSVETRGPTIARMIAEHAGKAPDDAAVRAAMGVQGAYLETAFAAMEDQHGSVDAYLREALGLDSARRAAFEQRFLG
jgi:protein tyrosine/serine phosphatase